MPSSTWSAVCAGVLVALGAGAARATTCPFTVITQCPAGFNRVSGTAGVDNPLNGTAGDDCIMGFGANDVINGGAGNDIICGGDGNDTIDGQDGADTIYGDNGNDTLIGNQGNDTIFGGPGNDTITGGGQNDVLFGDEDDDSLNGGGGNDFLDGGTGTNTLNGAGGTDSCNGTGGGCESTTPVALRELVVHRVDGQARLRWTTDAEAGITAFEVRRRGVDGVLRAVDEIPAMQESPVGGTYRWRDPLPLRAGTRVAYELVARGPGVALNLGRFDGVPDAAVDSPWLGMRQPHRLVAPLFRAAPPPLVPSSRLKLGVRTTGMVRVPAAVLAAHLGVHEDRVRAALTDGALRLWTGGDEGADVAWWSDARDPALTFYGVAPSTSHAAERVYYLTATPGTRMERKSAGTASTSLPPGSFVSTAEVERDVFAGTAVDPSPDRDFWFWSVLMSGTPGYESFTTTVPTPALARGTATLRLQVQGAARATHELSLFVNGIPAGIVRFSDDSRTTLERSVDGSLLRAGDNVVEVRIADRAVVGPSIVYVDRVELVHRRGFEVTDGQLALTASGSTTVGVAAAGARVFDVTSAATPVLLDGARTVRNTAGRRIGFVADADARYVVVERDGYEAPAWLRPDAPSTWRDAEHAAAYVVIAPAAMLAEAQNLATLRASSGLSTAVVDVADIYDEMGDGSPSPDAIRAFLHHAVTTWAEPPQYVVLAGLGSYDERDVLGFGENLVPTFMARTGQGLFASDARIADVVGDDGVADLAIGRIPAHGPAELAAYVEKLRRYEEAGDGGDAAFVADAVDNGTSFTASAESLAAALPFSTQLVSRDALSLSATRVAARAAFGTAAWLTYLGHGSVAQMGTTSLVGLGDVAALPATDTPPLLLAMTCTLGRFEIPGFDGLGDELVTKSDGGVIAAFAASALSDHEDASVFAAAVQRALVQQARLGDALLAAQSEHAAAGGAPNALLTYNLLGDPALRHRLPAAR